MRSFEHAAPPTLLEVASLSECSPLCLPADALGIQLSRIPRIWLGYSDAVLGCAHRKDPVRQYILETDLSGAGLICALDMHVEEPLI